MFLSSKIAEQFEGLAITHLRASALAREGDQNLALDQLRRFGLESGLFKFLVPKEFQGKGHSTSQILQALYGTTMGSLDLPFVSSLAAHSFVSADLINRFASSALKASVYPNLGVGSKIFGVANSEHGSGSDLRNIRSEIIGDEDNAQVLMNKYCVTNGSVCDSAICSLKIKNEIGIYLLDIKPEERRDLSTELFGFQSGLTGSIHLEKSYNDLVSVRLGSRQESIVVLKRCFDTERLVLGTMAAGLLAGIERWTLSLVTSDPKLFESLERHQYLQEKLIDIHSTRIQLESLIERILNISDDDFTQCQSELSVLKLLATTLAPTACIEFFGMLGGKAAMKDHFAQKLMRDMLAYRYFGGTVELHKNTIFRSLISNKSGRSVTRVS